MFAFDLEKMEPLCSKCFPGNMLDITSYEASFGTLVLESDLDMTPEAAYKTYSCRWEIELVMRFYKSACIFDETRVQDDYSVIASEFCDFLSTILTFRLINKFDQVSLLEKMTYKRVMQILRRAKMVKHSDGDWQLIKTAPSQLDVLQKLGLIDTSPSPKRKPGRPPKNCV